MTALARGQMEICALSDTTKPKPRPLLRSTRLRDAEVASLDGSICGHCSALLRVYDWQQTPRGLRRDCPECGTTTDEIVLHLPIHTLEN
jgi:hypothetical protein